MTAARANKAASMGNIEEDERENPTPEPDARKNYDNNRETFAYRLSELVFGSLLASYILGFVGFSANLIAANGDYTPWRVYDPVFAGPTSSAAADVFTLAIVAVYVLISLTFSMFTAAIYYNYHQSLLFLPADQRSSHWDFVLSLSLAVCFGFAMVAPRFSCLMLGVALSFVLLRRRAMLKAFFGYVTSHTRDRLNRQLNEGYAEGWDVDEKLRAYFVDEIAKSSDPTLRSWSSRKSWGELCVTWGGLSVCFASPWLLSAVYLSAPPSRSEESPPPSSEDLNLSEWVSQNSNSLGPILTALLLILLCYFLFRTLKNSTRAVGASDVATFQEDTNKAYAALLKTVEETAINEAGKR